MIVGMPGSGKTTAADLLGKFLRIKVVHSGDIARAEIKRRGWKLTPETDLKIRKYFHSHGREHIMVDRTLEQFKGDINIVESFRSMKEIDILRKRGYEVIIILIHAPFAVRAKRQQLRGRLGPRETLKYLKSRDKHELSIGLEQVIKEADFVIQNRGTAKQLEAHIKGFAKTINI